MPENPKYPISDWQLEVANGDTQLGYEQWVWQQQEWGYLDAIEEQRQEPEWVMSDNLFKVLTPEEEQQYRQWAREHYQRGSLPEPTWHPVVRDEWAKLDRMADPVMLEAPLRHFVVEYRDDTLLEDDDPYYFLCEAEDDEHAREQCVNAEPYARIVAVYPKEPEAESPCEALGHEYEFNRYCGADVCVVCDDHKGLARCFCGWSASGGDGRQELEDMGEQIDEDY